VGGNFADVHNRKRVQFITQIILAVLSLILAVTTLSNTVTPAIIYIVTIGTAIVVAFDLPARQALIPNLVDRKHLPSAMSLNFIMFQTSLVIGPAIGGFLIGASGVGIVYLINAFSFSSVLLALFLIKTSGEPIGEKSTVSLSAMLDGLKFVRSKTLIWSTMILDFFSTLFASATVILPIFAKDILMVGPEGLGLLYAAPSVGAVLTGLVMANFPRIKNQGIILLSAVGVFGVATIVFGLSKNFLVSLIALGFVGAGDSVSTIIRNVIRNIETPDYIRGRMTSINMIFFMGGPQLGEFEAGLLAAFVGAPLSVVVGGAGSLIVVGFVAAFIPTIRRYQNHES
jgi:MFS family permease